jgi:hypothetical protein
LVRIVTKRGPYVVVLLTALATALSACGSSAAATPCWKQVLNDWTATQRVNTTYPLACYDQALKNMGPDLRYYSDAPDAILAAKQSALTKKKVRRLQSLGGGSQNPTSGGGGGPTDPGGGSGPPQSPASAILNAGPSSADSLPLPLLLIAGVAILLLAAGAVGVANRHVQARRVAPDDPVA